MSRPTRVRRYLTPTGLSPAMADLSKSFGFMSRRHWPGPGSLATTTGVSVDVLSSGYLDVSVGRVRFVFLCIQKTMTLTGRVPPFGNPRIDGCSPLPTAYRSVLRPSSPLSAKAFTRCPYALDLCLEFFTHRDKRPCRSSSKPSSFLSVSSRPRTNSVRRRRAPAPQSLAKRTSQRLAGARKDPVRSQNAFLSTMTNSAPETTT